MGIAALPRSMLSSLLIRLKAGAITEEDSERKCCL